jgi:hypothetical protein
VERFTAWGYELVARVEAEVVKEAFDAIAE